MNKKNQFDSLLSLAHDIEAACTILETTANFKQACAEQQAHHAELTKENAALKARLDSVRGDIATALRRCDAECAAQREDTLKACAAQRAAVAKETEEAKRVAVEKTKTAAADLTRLESQYRSLQNAVAALEKDKKQLEAITSDLRQRLAAV